MNSYVPLPIKDEEAESLFTPENILLAYYNSPIYENLEDAAKDPEIFFEHNQWWLRSDDGQTVRTYSVVHCVSADGREFLDFEELGEVEY